MLPVSSAETQTPESKWYKALSTYEQPNRRKAVWQLLNTFGPYIALWALMVYLGRQGYSYWITLAFAAVAAALLIRRRFQAQLEEQGEADLTAYLNSNPLRASLEVRLTDPEDYRAVIERLRAEPLVTTVKDVGNLVDRVLTVTNMLRTAGAVVLAIVAVTDLFIIINSIRLAVLARADEIEIMRLVGASDAFIRWPFVFEGALIGILGAAITLGLLGLAADPTRLVLYDFFRVLPLQIGSLTRDLVVLVVGAGVGLGVVGS